MSIKIIIPYLSNDRPVSKTQTLINAYNILVQNLLSDFKFEPKYKEANFDRKSQSENFDSYSKVLTYSDNYKKDDNFKGILLFGIESWGCGKTHLINALANKWYKNPMVSITVNQFSEIIIEYRGISYQLIREESLILKILATYKKDSDEYESDIYKWLSRYDILAIDDVGKYIPNNLEFYRRVMFEIIDTRYNQNKGIILSTNFSKETLKQFLGMAIVDRLGDMTKGYQLEFKGKSLRGKNQLA
jgi:DNA replication protein DnaC